MGKEFAATSSEHESEVPLAVQTEVRFSVLISSGRTT